MITKIQKWGNSAGIRIPKKTLLKLDLKEGSTLKLEETSNSIILKKVTPKYYFDIRELVKKINPKNQHKLEDWGKPLGEEVW